MINNTSLHERPWLTIPEAMRLMRKGRAWVETRIRNREWLSVRDGARVKISTQSIKDWVEIEATAMRIAVGR